MRLNDVPLGEKKAITVLFCDMFNYTAICEEYSLSYVSDLLKAYYAAMAGSIVERNGVLGSFVGDAIIGYFGLQEEANTQDSAMAAALSILEKSEKFDLPNGQPIINGIGIDCGDILITKVSIKDSLGDHIVIGSPINTASRLEKLTRYSCHRMLITNIVHDALSEEMKKKVVRIGNRYVRGIEDSMTIYGEQLLY